MPDDKEPIPVFAKRIKEKYPEYKDIEDTLLVQKIVAKYPEYEAQVDLGTVKKKDFGGTTSSPLPSQSSDVPFKGKEIFGEPVKMPGQEPVQNAPLNEIADPVGKLVNKHEDKFNKSLSAINTFGRKGMAVSESTGQQAMKFDKDRRDTQVALQEDLAKSTEEYNKAAQKAEMFFFKDGKEAGAYVQDMLQKHKPEDLQNNKTVALAYGKYMQYEGLKKDLAENPDITQLAVERARRADKNLDQQILVLEGGKESDRGLDKYEFYLPQAMQGRMVDELLHDKNLKAIADENPNVKAQYDELQNGGIYKKYPEYGEIVARNMISREYQRRKANLIANPIFDKSKYLDNLADELFKDNPALKEIADTRLKGNWEHKIDTGGIIDEFGTGARNTLSQMGQSFKDLLGAGKSEKERIEEGLRSQYEAVSSGVSGWKAKLGHAANFAGMIATMAAAGTPLRGAGLSPRAVNAAITGSTFYDEELKTATLKHPGEPWKQHLEALAMTGLYTALPDIVPHAKIGGILAKAKPEISAALKNLSADATEAEIKNTLSNVILNTVKGIGKGTGEMMALTAINNGLDKALGLNGEEMAKYHPENEMTDVAENMLVGLAGPTLLGSIANRRATSNSLYSIASDPERYKSVLDLNSTPNLKEALEKQRENIDFLAETKSELDVLDISEKNKKRFLLEAMNEKFRRDKIAVTPESSLTRKANEEIRGSQEIQDKILNGEDVAGKEEAKEFTPQEKKAIDAIKAKDLSGTALEIYGKILSDENIAPDQKKMALREISDQLLAEGTAETTGSVLGKDASIAIENLGHEAPKESEALQETAAHVPPIEESAVSVTMPKKTGTETTKEGVTVIKPVTEPKSTSVIMPGENKAPDIVPLKTAEEPQTEPAAPPPGQRQVGIEPPSQPPIEPIKGATEEGGLPERRFTKQMLRSDELSAESKAEIAKTLNYTRQTNEMSLKEANEIIGKVGLDEAQNHVMNDPDIKPVVRVVMGQELIKKYNDLSQKAIDPAEKNYYLDKSIQTANFVTEKLATEAGQSIQAFSMWSRLSPEGQLRAANQDMARQGKEKLRRREKDIGVIGEKFKKANEETVDELSKSKPIKEAVEKTETQRVKKAKDKIESAKKKRENIIKKYKGDKGKNLYSGPGLTKEGIEFVGDLVATYVQEGVAKLEIVIDKVLEHLKQVTGKDTNDEVKKNVHDIVVDHLYKVENDKIRKGLVELERGVAKAMDEYKSLPSGVPAEAKDKMAADFSEKYNVDKNEVYSEIDNIINRKTKETKQEIPTLEQKINQGVAELEKEINKIVREHYTVPEESKKKLIDKFIDKVGLDKEEATALAKEIETEFDKIATRKKRNILYNEKARFDKIQNTLKTGEKKEPKTVQDELIKYSNLGAFENKDFEAMVASKFGIGELTKDQAAKLLELANKVKNAPEGSPKNQATEDLLAYRANLRGNDKMETAQAIWYANILSGYKTHEKNLVSTFFNSMGELGAEMAKDPKAIPYLIAGYVKGLTKRGLVEAGHTLSTGRSPIHIKKIETPSTLERKNFVGGNWNPGNWFKYVTRLMVAEDVLSFQGLKEARAYQLARREAQNQGFNTWSKKGWDKVNEILLHTKERMTEAQEQADTEGLKGLENKRRVYELMEENRPIKMTEDAYGFAAHGTFNHESEGSLGALTNAVAKSLDAVSVGGAKPLRFIVPFTRIITNVVNNSLDFTPVGLIRAARGVRGFKSFEENQYTKGAFKELSREERHRLIAKAAIGITLAASFQAMHQAGIIQITGAGTGDQKKDEQLRESGWQEYSIKIGNKWYSYKYSPLVFMLGFLGNMNDAAEYEDEDTIIKRMELAASRLGGQVADMTWINSASTFLGALTEPNPDKQARSLNNTIASTVKGFVPFSGAITQISQGIQSAFDMPKKQVSGAWQTLIQDIPIARNSLNDKVNALGDPVIRDSDVIMSKQSDDPVWKYLLDKKGWVAPVNKNTIIIFDPELKMDRPVTDDEYYEFSKLRGQKIKEQINKIIEKGATIKAKLHKIKKTAEELTSKELNILLSNISREATKDAKEELFAPKESKRLKISVTK